MGRSSIKIFNRLSDLTLSSSKYIAIILIIVNFSGLILSINAFSPQNQEFPVGRSEPVPLSIKERDPGIMKTIYVSPDGVSNASGTAEDPFPSIEAARDFIRTINDDMTGDIVVYLMDGNYIINDTILFGPEDSGTNGFNIIYRAYPGAKPVIYGGTGIGNWTRYTKITLENGTEYTIWRAPSPIEDFRQLYINGTRMIRARGEPTMIESSDGDGHELNDLSILNWRNLRDVEFVYKAIWKLRRIKVGFYYEARKKLYMQEPAYGWARSMGGTIIGEPTWIENAFELLDNPGEFYLDPSEGNVYLITPCSEDPNSDTIIVPNVQPLMNISGTFENKVKNLKFQELSFQYSTWLKPNEHGTCFVDQQANVYIDYKDGEPVYKMSPGAVYIENSTNIAVQNCTFTHLGSGGLDLRGGLSEIVVTGNVFNDISGIALQVGEIFHPNYPPEHPGVVKDILIKNNYIVNSSLEYRGGPGIFACYVRNVTITHNTISNLPYTGISVGWGWSSKLSIMANNTITFNRIYGVMNYMQDGGGIYTLSTQPGTNVSYNVIYDCGWNGLYPDERTNGTVWSYNVVWDTYNSFLDHSMYEESKWNKVHNNYLETYPRYLWVWYEDRDDEQIFGLRPGMEGFPDDIVERSGVEPEYRHLIPENEHYWHYTEVSNEILLITAKDEFIAAIIIIALLQFVGIAYTIVKIHKTSKLKNGR